MATAMDHGVKEPHLQLDRTTFLTSYTQKQQKPSVYYPVGASLASLNKLLFFFLLDKEV
jgi:arginine exporter protein ArgO